MNPPRSCGWLARALARCRLRWYPSLVGTAAGYQLERAFVAQHAPGERIRATAAWSASRSTRELSWLNAVLALVVALGIQIGTNYVNDYADGVRGTDEHRVGPVRLVAGKLATVRQVKIAALVAFGVAGIAGLDPGGHGSPGGSSRSDCVRYRWVGLHGRTQALRLPGVGRDLRLRVLRARRDGRIGLRAARALHDLPGPPPVRLPYNWGFALWAGVPVGLLAAALLEANNLRDVDTDADPGKKTLAVRLGRRARASLRRDACARPLSVSASWRTIGSGRSSPWPPSAGHRSRAPGPERQAGGELLPDVGRHGSPPDVWSASC